MLYLSKEGCALAGGGKFYLLLRDFGNLQKILAFCGVIF